jgi:hypothetical protein
LHSRIGALPLALRGDRAAGERRGCVSLRKKEELIGPMPSLAAEPILSHICQGDCRADKACYDS